MVRQKNGWAVYQVRCVFCLIYNLWGSIEFTLILLGQLPLVTVYVVIKAFSWHSGSLFFVLGGFVLYSIYNHKSLAICVMGYTVMTYDHYHNIMSVMIYGKEKPIQI